MNVGTLDSVLNKIAQRVVIIRNDPIYLCVTCACTVILLISVILLLHRRKKKLSLKSDSEVTTVIVQRPKEQIEDRAEKKYQQNISCHGCMGQGKRSYQEDCMWAGRNRDFFAAVLCDGMGGMDNGKESAEIGVQCFEECFQQIDPHKEIPKQLRAISVEANRKIFRRNEEMGLHGGCTFIAILIHDADLYWISIGDSRIFLGSHGKLAAVNEEHELESRLYNYIMQMGSNDDEFPDFAAFPPGELRKLTSNLGREAIPLIDQNLRPYRMDDETRILLCSDGISDTLSSETIKRSLLAGSSEKCADMLFKEVMIQNKPHQDNFSALAVFYQPKES